VASWGNLVEYVCLSFVPVCMNSIVKVEEDKQRRSRRAEKSTRVWKRYCKNRFT